MTDTGLTPWYDDLVQMLVRAQVGTREGHLALASGWRGASINLARIAEAHATISLAWREAAQNIVLIAGAHETLAANVPDAAQAAADLGTSTERHDLNNLRAAIQGEQQLAKLLEADVQRILQRMDELDRDGKMQRGEMARLLLAVAHQLGVPTEEPP